MTTQELWQSQELDAPRISLELVRDKSEELYRRTRLRNAKDYYATVLGSMVLLVGAWTQFRGMPLMQLGCVYTVLVGAFQVRAWHRLACAARAPTDAGVLDSLRFHRHELARQRDAHLGKWRWLPRYSAGAVLICLSLAVERDQPGGTIALVALYFAALYAVFAWRWRREARRLAQEIDALESMGGAPTN